MIWIQDRWANLHWPLWKDIARGLGYAFMIGLVTLGLLILVAVINRVYFNEPAIKVVPLGGDRLPSPVCPGQELEVRSHITVKKPMSIFSYFSVMDEGMNFNYAETQVPNQPRPHPHPATFNQKLLWRVPDLPPGKYSRVLWYRGTDTSEDSIYTWTYFEIGEDCER